MSNVKRPSLETRRLLVAPIRGPGFHSRASPRNFTGGAQKKAETEPHGRTYPRTAHFLRREETREREGERVVERIRSGPTTQFRRVEPRGPRRVLIAGYGACN